MQNLVDQSFDMTIPKWQKIIIYLMIATAFSTFLASLYVPIYDGDIWFHLLYGKAILENHSLIPDHTIYSWTPSSNERIYCAWIGQIIYYLLYTSFGNGGIIIFRYIAASTLFIAILFLSRQRNTFYNPITWFTASLCTLLIYQVALDKPEILSFAFMSLIVWNWYKIKQIKQNVFFQIYLFPLLILIWVNSHGGFIYGCLFLFCVGLGETINQLFYQQHALTKKIYYHLLFALFLSAGCTLLTPYGYDYIYQLVLQYYDEQTKRDFSQVVSYASTFDLPNNPQLPIFADIAIGIILLVFSCSFHKRQLDFVPIISNLVFAFLFTIYGRLILPWIAVFSLSIVYYSTAVSVIQRNRNVFFISTFFLATFILSGWLLHHEKQHPLRGVAFGLGVSERSKIDEEIDFINDNYKNIRLGNMYDHGSYILWKYWPQMKVMMDARYFPYKNWFNEYTTFAKGVNVEMFIKKFPFDAIAISHYHITLLNWFHRSKDWQLVFYGKSAAVFVRSSLALSNKIIAGHSLNNIREFPIATGALYTSILAKDWSGADTILNTMNRNFTNQRQQNIVSGFADIKLAAQMYEKKRYSTAILAMEKAADKQVSHKPLYAAALLMKAIEDWQDKQWSDAIKNTIKSLMNEKSFAGYYNLALMVWQMETNNNLFNYQLNLTNEEEEMISKWRNILALLTQNKNKYPQHYFQYIENAENILNGHKNCKTQLVVPDYL